MSWLRTASGRVSRYFRFDIYRRLIPYLRPYKLSMIVVIALTILATVLSMLDPWPLQILIDSGLGNKALPAFVRLVLPFVRGTGASIIVFAVVLQVGLFVLGAAVNVVSTYLKNRVNTSIILHFKADLFRHLQHLGFRYHDRSTVGDSMYRLDNDTEFISVMIWGNFRHLLTSTLTLIGIVAITFRLDWQLALLALVSAPILYGSIGLSSAVFKARAKQIKAMESAANTIIQEVLSCLRVVKAFGTEEREQGRFERQSWTALRASWKLSILQDVFAGSMGLVTQLNRSIILLFGGFQVLHGQLTLGELFVIQAYIAQIHEPMSDLGDTLTDMQLSLASAERTLEVMDVEPDIIDRPGAVALAAVEGAVAFQHVNFGYQRDRPVLHDICFRTAPGDVIAIVGPTGAGKTTLSNLIARFYDPDEGSVTLDGHDLRDLTVATLRDSIALVIQEPILFTGTIRDNIAYGRPDASFAQIEEAAKAANAHDFIQALPNGYDAEIGQRGVRLSGGERQRIAIARAFLKDAPVLILDEPTSSVDSRTELVILEALDRLMEGRTTFIIAHRLSTIRRADQILVVDAGRIVERGTHTQLMESDGLYAEFFRIQAAGLRRDREEQPITVTEWIAGGRPDVTHDQVVAAAMGAEVDAFITDLPDGYDTLIGQGATELTAEQREGLALARSLLAETLSPEPGVRGRARLRKVGT